MKEQCASAIVRWSFKKMKTTVSFNSNSVTISNPAMLYCKDLKHEKSKAGMKQIINAFKELGAKEGKDFIIENE